MNALVYSSSTCVYKLNEIRCRFEKVKKVVLWGNMARTFGCRATLYVHIFEQRQGPSQVLVIVQQRQSPRQSVKFGARRSPVSTKFVANNSAGPTANDEGIMLSNVCSGASPSGLKHLSEGWCPDFRRHWGTILWDKGRFPGVWCRLSDRTTPLVLGHLRYGSTELLG